MVVKCKLFGRVYNDESCWAICPHGPLWAKADAYCPKHDLVDCWICREEKRQHAHIKIDSTIRSAKYSFASESELQDAIGQLLQSEGIIEGIARKLEELKNGK